MCRGPGFFALVSSVWRAFAVTVLEGHWFPLTHPQPGWILQPRFWLRSGNPFATVVGAGERDWIFWCRLCASVVPDVLVLGSVERLLERVVPRGTDALGAPVSGKQALFAVDGHEFLLLKTAASVPRKCRVAE